MKRFVAPPPVPVERIRFCVACGSTYPPEGPLPYACDHHWHEGRMIMTCSNDCRAELGLDDRKPVA